MTAWGQTLFAVRDCPPQVADLVQIGGEILCKLTMCVYMEVG